MGLDAVLGHNQNLVRNMKRKRLKARESEMKISAEGFITADEELLLAAAIKNGDLART